MKKYTILLVGLLLSCWAIGQTIQNGQNGSNFTTISQLTPSDQLIAEQEKLHDQNALIDTYQGEIWVIEFTSDSTFIITEGKEVIIPKAMITRAVLTGLIEAYHTDSTKSTVDVLELKLGRSFHQMTQTRNLDMLLYSEHSFGNKAGDSEYKLLEDMVSTSDINLISNEKEFYKELDNMISGILVNVIFKPEEVIEIQLDKRYEEMMRNNQITPV